MHLHVVGTFLAHACVQHSAVGAAHLCWSAAAGQGEAAHMPCNHGQASHCGFSDDCLKLVLVKKVGLAYAALADLTTRSASKITTCARTVLAGVYKVYTPPGTRLDAAGNAWTRVGRRGLRQILASNRMFTPKFTAPLHHCSNCNVRHEQIVPT